MKVRNEYFISALTVDNVIFGFDDGDLKVLLIKRHEEPFLNNWALPGDFVQPTEDLDLAPKRILKELTGLDNVFLEQVSAFGNVKRHPSGRVLTVAYYSLVNLNKIPKLDQGFLGMVKWTNVLEIDDLPFDHMDILVSCLDRLKQHVRIRPIGFELLPNKFTLSELQSLYESVLNKSLDKRNFRKKIISMGILVDAAEFQEGVAHRPAKLYQFDEKKYEEFMSAGFVFEI